MKVSPDDDLFTGGEIVEVPQNDRRQLIVTPQAGNPGIPWIPILAAAALIYILTKKK